MPSNVKMYLILKVTDKLKFDLIYEGKKKMKKKNLFFFSFRFHVEIFLFVVA